MKLCRFGLLSIVLFKFNINYIVNILFMNYIGFPENGSLGSLCTLGLIDSVNVYTEGTVFMKTAVPINPSPSLSHV